MRAVITWNAPEPRGHYAQAVVHNGVVYISGILPINPKSEEIHVGTLVEQTQQVLDNLYTILIAAGSEVKQVLKTTVYISDISHWDKVNELYAVFFGRHRPARTIVPTKKLHHGFSIEIDAIAAVSE